jgi:hypothetical protein
VAPSWTHGWGHVTLPWSSPCCYAVLLQCVLPVRARAAALVGVLAHLVLQVVVGFRRLCEHRAELGERLCLLLQAILQRKHGICHNVQISWAVERGLVAILLQSASCVVSLNLLHRPNGCIPPHPHGPCMSCGLQRAWRIICATYEAVFR